MSHLGDKIGKEDKDNKLRQSISDRTKSPDTKKNKDDDSLHENRISRSKSRSSENVPDLFTDYKLSDFKERKTSAGKGSKYFSELDDVSSSWRKKSSGSKEDIDVREKDESVNRKKSREEGRRVGTVADVDTKHGGSKHDEKDTDSKDEKRKGRQSPSKEKDKKSSDKDKEKNMKKKKKKDSSTSDSDQKSDSEDEKKFKGKGDLSFSELMAIKKKQ